MSVIPTALRKRGAGGLTLHEPSSAPTEAWHYTHGLPRRCILVQFFALQDAEIHVLSLNFRLLDVCAQPDGQHLSLKSRNIGGAHNSRGRLLHTRPELAQLYPLCSVGA